MLPTKPQKAPSTARWTVPSVSTRMLLLPKFSKVAAILGGDRGVSSVQGVGGEWTLSLICATLCHVGPKAALGSPKISFKDIFISIWCSPMTQSPGSSSIQVVVWKFMLSYAFCWSLWDPNFQPHFPSSPKCQWMWESQLNQPMTLITKVWIITRLLVVWEAGIGFYF